MIHELFLLRLLKHSQEGQGKEYLFLVQDDPEITLSYFRLHGLDGWVAAASAAATEGGSQWAVISIAAAESFPEGVLEGVVAHWGVAGSSKVGGWEAPPKGWLADPGHVNDSGCPPSRALPKPCSTPR